MDADDEGVWQDGVLVLWEGRKDKTSGRGSWDSSIPTTPPNYPSITCPVMELNLAHHHHLVVGCKGDTRSGGLPGTPESSPQVSDPLSPHFRGTSAPSKRFWGTTHSPQSWDTSVLITWGPTGALGRGTPPEWDLLLSTMGS